MTIDRVSLLVMAASLSAVTWLVVEARRPERHVSPASLVFLGALAAIAAAVALASSPFALVAYWELGAVLLHAFLQTRIPIDDERSHRGAGQLLLTGLLMDGMLLTAASSVAAWSGASAEMGMGRSGAGPYLALAMVFAAVGRCGLLPASGAIRYLRSLDGWTAAAAWMLGLIGPALIFFARAGGLLSNVSSSRTGGSIHLSLAGLLAMVGLMALFSAVAQPQPSHAREYLAMVAGAAGGVISIALDPLGGCLAGLSLMGVWGFSVSNDRLPVFARHSSPEKAASTQLQRLAARDWGIPQLWWSLVELPLRGTAQLSRFIDGFVFDRTNSQISHRMAAAAARLGTGTPGDPFWLPAVSLLVVVGLLAFLTWR